jgi:hypothetical protein
MNVEKRPKPRGLTFSEPSRMMVDFGSGPVSQQDAHRFSVYCRSSRNHRDFQSDDASGLTKRNVVRRCRRCPQRARSDRDRMMPFAHRYCLSLVPHTANLLAADRNLRGSRNILWSQRPGPTGYSIPFLQPEDNIKKRFHEIFGLTPLMTSLRTHDHVTMNFEATADKLVSSPESAPAGRPLQVDKRIWLWKNTSRLILKYARDRRISDGPWCSNPVDRKREPLRCAAHMPAVEPSCISGAEKR